MKVYQRVAAQQAMVHWRELPISSYQSCLHHTVDPRAASHFFAKKKNDGHSNTQIRQVAIESETLKLQASTLSFWRSL